MCLLNISKEDVATLSSLNYTFTQEFKLTPPNLARVLLAKVLKKKREKESFIDLKKKKKKNEK
jgi:hypothetical protein